MTYPVLTADEAARLLPHGGTLGLGGFTEAGTPTAVAQAFAEHARAEHRAGRACRIRLVTGASTGPLVDDGLAESDALEFRAPFMSSAPLRARINAGTVAYADQHLSQVSPLLLAGLLGRVDLAVVEATEVTADGKVFLTNGIGIAPTLLRVADRVVIEVNRRQPHALRDLADLLVLPMPPHRGAIPITGVLDRIGTTWAQVDPRKVVGVVETAHRPALPPFAPPEPVTTRIAQHIAAFLDEERHARRLPRLLLPMQVGVGNVANNVLLALGRIPELPPLSLYTEVFQDAGVTLAGEGRLVAASASALTLSTTSLEEVYQDLDRWSRLLRLRPSEVSNHPAVVRQLGLIAINTALEVDVYGHVNSTHVAGTQVMNGIGGSSDFERNAHLALFICPSTAKEGRVSAIVPMASHVDHSEHSVQVVVTEQGLADLRGVAPGERARRIIGQCAHPSYREALSRYISEAPPGHLRHDLAHAFDFHRRFLESGTMRA